MAYIKMVKARDSDMVDDISACNDGDPDLLECYVDALESNANVVSELGAIGSHYSTRIDMVVLIGGVLGETRVYIEEADALIAEDGTVWMDEEQYEMLSC